MATLEDHPFGQTEYKHYDPDQINTAEDVADLFEWLSDINESEGNAGASGAFGDCAEILRSEVLGNDE